MSGPGPIDHYQDGAWYDAEYVHIRGDVPYYAAIGEREGRILELAAGTGRLSIPMAEAGAVVHGVDLSSAMVDRAEDKRGELPGPVRERLSFQVADMRSVRVDGGFDAVVLAFNTLMHMVDDDDLQRALQTVHAHLEPGGRFYFDLHTPLTDLLVRDPEGRFDPQQMIDPRTGHRYVVTENNRYDPRRQINLMRFYYQQVDGDERPIGKERYTELRLRVLFPRELDHWLDLTGFDVTAEWDDFECTQPFSARGGRRIVVATRR